VAIGLDTETPQKVTGKRFVDFFADLLPFIVPILTLIGGMFLERRMREANVEKAEAEAEAKRAEAQKMLAEAEKLFAEADNEEAQGLAEIIGAWRTLYEQAQGRMAGIEAEQTKQRAEHERVLEELRWYRHGVSILIAQLRRLGVEPEWTPAQEKNGK
jgi:hypothetical protein